MILHPFTLLTGVSSISLTNNDNDHEDQRHDSLSEMIRVIHILDQALEIVNSDIDDDRFFAEWQNR